jgi:hypothetical protein
VEGFEMGLKFSIFPSFRAFFVYVFTCARFDGATTLTPKMMPSMYADEKHINNIASLPTGADANSK